MPFYYMLAQVPEVSLTASGLAHITELAGSLYHLALSGTTYLVQLQADCAREIPPAISGIQALSISGLTIAAV